MTPIKIPKKLIEVALPLDDINVAASKEKSIRHGHPSTLHLWWARRPLAAARAVIFAQMVNDPGFENGNGFQRGLKKKEAEIKREELFQIIRDLVKWENTNNEDVLKRAREAIKESWLETCVMNKNHPQAKELFDPEKLPAFHDPFAGGGAIPLEAQRLGLESYASDLNPVAVMINKAMIEIPPKFAGRAPVGPIPTGEKQSEMPREWYGTQGLAEDVRRYGHWMREEAFKRIGHLYPKVKVTEEMVKERSELKQYVGQELTVIAWLWARTVKSPNPAFSNADTPLVSTFVLSNKKGNQVWVEPKVNGLKIDFHIKMGNAPKDADNGTKLGRGANFRCLFSDTPIAQDYIRSEFVSKRSSEQLMAVVLSGKKGRFYIEPTLEMERIAKSSSPSWKPDQEMNQDSKDLVSGRGYGFQKWSELFSNRQMILLTTYIDLVAELKTRILEDCYKIGITEEGKCLSDNGSNSLAYSEAIAVYLTLAVTEPLPTSVGRFVFSMILNVIDNRLLGDVARRSTKIPPRPETSPQ